MKKINLLTVLILLSTVLVAYLSIGLPDIVPVHINMNGDVDRYHSKWFILLGPAIALIGAISIQIYLRKTKNKSPEALQLMMSAILAVAALGICWLPYIIATEIGLKNTTVMLGVPIGIMFVIMGNYMGLLKTNSVVGIRTKWTFADEEIWQKTHRLAGYIMVAGGFLILLITLIEFLLHTKLLIIAILAIILIMALTTTYYSYVLYKQKYKS